MILHTGLRTDIPAFYTPWFVNRLRAGSVCVRSPYRPELVTRYRLAPDVVDLIAFCTKNPGPMLPWLDLLRPYGQFWFVTVTPYGPEIEPNVPPKAQVLANFRKLSRMVGTERIAWRYDPIFLSDDYPAERHIREFSRMAAALAGYTDTCVISFVDLYPKVRRSFPELRAVPPAERLRLGRALVEIARGCGMTVRPCAEGSELAPYGADCSGCMTVQTFERALHGRLHIPGAKAVRGQCACYLSCDIGQYNTCGHLCRYCYANADPDAVRRSMRLHDPDSPFLIGRAQPGDIIRDAKQESWLDGQTSFL